MDPEDRIADLEEEVRFLRSRVVELEEQLHRALERKVEETDEGVPPEEQGRQNWAKKEEATGSSGLGIMTIKHEVKYKIKPKTLGPINDVTPLITANGESRNLSPTYLQDDEDDDDDVIIVDSVRQSPGKRKGGSGQPSPRPKKRQTFWVEVPPRPKRVPSVPAKREPPSPKVVMNGEGASLVVKQEPDQEASNALSIIRNAKLKPDKKSLDNVSVFTRLSRVGLEIFPTTIEDEIKELSVSRPKILSKYFGGSPVGTHPQVKEEKFKQHGFGNFMYIKMSVHPHAPSFPGAPGLWMCICPNCAGIMEDVRLVVRVNDSPALWQYMGQYDLRPSDPFSTQEWVMQSDQTKRAWVNYICKKPWGSSARARIRIRQLKGREPTGQEVNEFLKDKSHNVTMTDIREAFDKGEERLHTWTLKCRGYDERFQREIWRFASGQAKEE